MVRWPRRRVPRSRAVEPVAAVVAQCSVTDDEHPVAGIRLRQYRTADTVWHRHLYDGARTIPDATGH